MESKREEAENEILIVAMKVFTEKGYKGATMRNIAKEANINLAMLNYYFKSKDNLFDIIFDRSFDLIYGKIFGVLSAENPLFEKIRLFTDTYIQILIENPTIPNFIFSEITHNPTHITKKMSGNKKVITLLNNFQKQIDNEIKANNLKPIKSIELLINLMALCVFPFIAQPMIKAILGLPDLNYVSMLEQRKSSVAEFIINSIKK